MKLYSLFPNIGLMGLQNEGLGKEMSWVLPETVNEQPDSRSATQDVSSTSQGCAMYCHKDILGKLFITN